MAVGEQHLPERAGRGRGRSGATGQEVFPQPLETLVVFLVIELGVVALEVLQPAARGRRVVADHVLHVVDRHVAVLDVRGHLRERRRATAGEDVFLGEGVARIVLGGATDAVHETHPVLGQHLLDVAEEGRIVAELQMLEHADAYNLLERARRRVLVRTAPARGRRRRARRQARSRASAAHGSA